MQEDRFDEPRSGDLVVSSKVLGHISEGLYRGPAGVLKELISNAFDANATTVWISTGRPSFDVVSIRDDGDGMDLQGFLRLVDGGIGDSTKRSNGLHLLNQRKVIGRLGIGLLGVAQISHEFSIVSHNRSTKTAFEASVWMQDFRSDILDTADDSDYSVGGYEVEPVPFDPEIAGLTITAIDPTEGFRKQLSEDKPDPLPPNFRDFVSSNREKAKLATGSWYNRMIWQVASLAPIEYFPDSHLVTSEDNMAAIACQLSALDFSVIIDGVKIFKPILLDGPTIHVPLGERADGEGPFHFPMVFNKTIWGSELTIGGYLHGSAGTALHPDDIRGVLIRLKHVGIGQYDKSFLEYRSAEGPRFAWLTGELYVTSGLEDALTVARDGFDIGHPHYVALRQWLHKELQDRVFPTLIRSIRARRMSREAERTTTRNTAFTHTISEFADTELRVVEVSDRQAPPVHINLSKGTVSVNSLAKWPRGKRRRETAQRLSIVFELVRHTDTDASQITDFIKLTEQVLAQS